MERSLALTEYRNHKTPIPAGEHTLSWPQVVELFSKREIRGDTGEDGKHGRAFSFVKLRSGTKRANENVEFASALVYDVDDGNFEDISPRLGGVLYLSYSTHTSTAVKPKLRLILPLRRDVLPAEWPALWAWGNRKIGNVADPATKDIARLSFFPSCTKSNQADAWVKSQPGAFLDPDNLNVASAPAIKSALTVSEAARRINEAFDVPGYDSPDAEKVCVDGERTAHLTKLAGMWIGQGCSLDQTIALAVHWNASNLPPLDAAKVQSTCAGIWNSHERKRANGVKPPQLTPAAAMSAPISAQSIGAAFGGVTPTVLPPLFDLASARVTTMLRSEPAPRKWVLDDFLPAGIVGGIVAPGGTGKSFLALQLAVSVASGCPLAGEWKVSERGGVLGLFAEDDTDEIHRRLRRIVGEQKDRGLISSEQLQALDRNLFLKSMLGFNNLMTESGPMGQVNRTAYVSQLISVIRGIDSPKLLIVDPASRFRGGDENRAEDMTEFVNALQQVVSQTGVTVMVLHHANKGSMSGKQQSQSAARGSSAFTDAVRFQLNLSPGNPVGIHESEKHLYLEARVTKSNYAAPHAPVMLRRLNGYLHKVDLTAAGGQHSKVAELIRRIAQEEPGTYSINSFADLYGGASNTFGLNDKDIRRQLAFAVEAKYLTKGKRGTLTITEMGRAVADACEEPA